MPFVKHYTNKLNSPYCRCFTILFRIHSIHFLILFIQFYRVSEHLTGEHLNVNGNKSPHKIYTVCLLQYLTQDLHRLRSSSPDRVVSGFKMMAAASCGVIEASLLPPAPEASVVSKKQWNQRITEMWNVLPRDGTHLSQRSRVFQQHNKNTNPEHKSKKEQMDCFKPGQGYTKGIPQIFKKDWREKRIKGLLDNYKTNTLGQ